MESLSSKKRVRYDSNESAVDSVEAKRILLDILDDSDVCTVSHDLDSFMKTFQDEISPAPEVAEITSKSTARPELGFLFEASDDELGLPPTDTNTSLTGFEKTRVLAESVELSELWELDDQFSSYGSFEYEFVNDDVNINNNYNSGEYVALDGLFDHTDLGFGSSDLSWRNETFPAQ
ncbi:hypothetical protein L1987_10974 [Smallanthus sonchifolius]|uniref:Uncharacterized protein n=1 Tax=Smallanthus sonchifolius TaxID=185202 RepID=A0ACB9JA85_9ASTR|nr:hypothetical protein L1987_10974 [Smallanthus sonchifolius]